MKAFLKAFLFILALPFLLALIAALCAWASFAVSWSAGQGIQHSTLSE